MESNQKHNELYCYNTNKDPSLSHFHKKNYNVIQYQTRHLLDLG